MSQHVDLKGKHGKGLGHFVFSQCLHKVYDGIMLWVWCYYCHHCYSSVDPMYIFTKTSATANSSEICTQ